MLPCGIPLITLLHDENLLLILTLILLLNKKEHIQSIISGFTLYNFNFSGLPTLIVSKWNVQNNILKYTMSLLIWRLDSAAINLLIYWRCAMLSVK